jgi:hypothetical protein
MFRLARTATAVGWVLSEAVCQDLSRMSTTDDRYLCRVQEFRESLRIIHQVCCHSIAGLPD